MKVKVSLLVTAVSILKDIDTTEMKLSTAYKVSQLMKTTQESIDGFDARRVKLAEKHGTLNEENTHYNFADTEAEDTFKKDLNAMLDDEIDLKITKIPVALLDDYINIKPSDIKYVEWFISGIK